MAQRERLPDPWPEAVFAAMVSVVGQCPTGQCCTAETDGDICGSCTEVYVQIAEALRPTIEQQARTAQRGER